MATKYTGDEKADALKTYATNHASWGEADEYEFWHVNRSLSAIPWGPDATSGRIAQINAAATALSITLTQTDPWPREQEFWTGLKAAGTVAP